MEEEVVSKLINFIESASPVIWEAAQRQVTANMVSNIIWILLLVAVITASVVVAKKLLGTLSEYEKHNAEADRFDKKDDEGVAVGFICVIALAVVCAIFLVVLSAQTAKMAINPTYYALSNIISLVQ